MSSVALGALGRIENAPHRPGIGALEHALANRRFVSYQPTAITALNGVLTTADRESIRSDLTTLRPWFDALVTYGALHGAEWVADVASTLGFGAVIQGVWDAFDGREIQNAIAAAARNKGLVVALSLGNETVLAGRSTWAGLAQVLKVVRKQVPSLPLATSEPFAKYLDDPSARLAIRQMDAMLVHIHPIFESWFRSGTPANWTEFVTSVTARLEAIFSGPILVKETGVPSGPKTSGFDETMQHDFWRALEAHMRRSRRSAFSYFTAFDSPWRANDATPVSGPRPEEAHWGLFTSARAPKLVMNDLPKL
jgi:exo-beta-1,3-glucanase (GH17 family)